jgi:hypothetical protein
MKMRDHNYEGADNAALLLTLLPKLDEVPFVLDEINMEKPWLQHGP